MNTIEQLSLMINTLQGQIESLSLRVQTCQQYIYKMVGEGRGGEMIKIGGEKKMETVVKEECSLRYEDKGGCNGLGLNKVMEKTEERIKQEEREVGSTSMQDFLLFVSGKEGRNVKMDAGRPFPVLKNAILANHQHIEKIQENFEKFKGECLGKFGKSQEAISLLTNIITKIQKIIDDPQMAINRKKMKKPKSKSVVCSGFLPNFC